MPSRADDHNRRSRLARAIDLRQGELPGLLGGFAYFFCLLCSYYIMRPVRDEMGVRGGVEDMQWLFTATFVAMLLAVPVFAALATRFRRTRLIPAVYGLFLACIVGFWLWLQSDVAMVWAARTFFVWLSVFNLFVVSVFWSYLADLFDDAAAARLFGAIAAGGSAGAILGPSLTAVVAQHVAPARLLLLAGAILALTLPCMALLDRWSRRRTDGGGAGDAGSGEALGGTLLEGVQALARSRYTLGICGFIWLYTTLATFLYFSQAEIVSGAFGDSGDRTTVFAVIDALTNTLTVGIQLFLTGRIVQRFGLGRTLAFVPLLVAAGFLILAAAPVLVSIMAIQVVRRAGNYAIAKPGREMLWTVLPRMEKYKSKNFVDTVVYRGGDAIAGWLYKGLASLGLGIPAIALIGVPLGLIWAVLGYRLGRTRERRSPAERAMDPAAAGQGAA